MNILITGGTGFIGSHLIYRLLKLNHNIFLLKRSFSKTWRIKDILNQLIVFDIDKLDTLDEIFNNHKIELVMHLAGKHFKHHSSFEEAKELNESNIILGANILEVAIKYHVRGFINTGTFSEYRPAKEPLSEKNLIKPYNYYSVTKIAFEQFLKYYAIKNKIRGVTLKLFSPYGDKDNDKIIPLVIKSIIHKKHLVITNMYQKLSFTYVEDVIDAYIKAMKFIMSDDYKHYEQFNIGSGKYYSIEQLIKIIEKITNNICKILPSSSFIPKSELYTIRCNFSKAKRMIGWYPKTDIYTGLKKTYDYYLNYK